VVEGCIFCAIAEGLAPAVRVYQDDFVIAIMDIHPATTSHVLVVPKNHSPDLWHVSRHDAQRAMTASVHVARMIREALHPDGINLLHATGSAAWQTVFHFHLHLVPRYEGDGLVPPWRSDRRAEDFRLEAVAERIRSAGVAGPGME
jgi:histidine triad (HIT) family protein